MPVFWRVRLLILTAVVVVLACLGGYWAAVAVIRANVLAPFKPHLAEYLAPAGPVEAGPVRGKMIVIDQAARDVDSDVFFALPEALRAARPEDVGAVVWLEYGREQDPRYSYGEKHLPAFRQTCTVRVIDRADHHVLANVVARGGDPPGQIDENAQEGVGPKPVPEVVSYLTRLPRK